MARRARRLRSRGAAVKIPVLQKNFRAWPKSETGGAAIYTDIAHALVTEYRSDAHFACYSHPDVARRLCVELVRDPQNASLIPDGIPMAVVSFDVDAEMAHKSSGARTPVPAPDEWWLSEQPKIRVLLDAHPGAFVYRTRGGYRIVYVLPLPFILRTAEDDERWTTTYVRWCAYLRRRFDICADASCADWTRLFRLPHATREREKQPERRETIGTPSEIGAWACEPSAEDIALALTLKKQKKPKAKRESKRVAAIPANGEGVLFHAFKAKGELGSEIEPGKWAVRCPQFDLHSKGDALDTSTILYAPKRSRAFRNTPARRSSVWRRPISALSFCTDQEKTENPNTSTCSRRRCPPTPRAPSRRRTGDRNTDARFLPRSD